MNHSAQTTEDAPQQQLSHGLRTLVSLLLFVWLFALAVVVLAHTGDSELTSEIRRRVPLLQPAMRRLWMDQTYTYADYVNPQRSARLDSQFLLQVEYEFADGTTESVQLPRDTDWLETRRRRYLTLARSLAAVVGDDIEAVYASMLAAGFLAEQPNAVALRLSCVERFTPSASDEAFDHPDAVQGDDGLYTATIYRCRAWFNDEDGSIEIKKDEEPRRLSLVKKPIKTQ